MNMPAKFIETSVLIQIPSGRENYEFRKSILSSDVICGFSILVVSKTIDFLRSLSSIFSPNFIIDNRIQITLCDDLTQGIIEAEEGSYKLILLDKNYLRLSGHEILYHLNSFSDDIKVI